MIVNKMATAKVEDDKSLVRDLSSNAILNTNKDELIQHRNVRRMRKQNEETVIQLESRINSLESLVKQLLNNITTNKE